MGGSNCKMNPPQLSVSGDQKEIFAEQKRWREKSGEDLFVPFSLRGILFFAEGYAGV